MHTASYIPGGSSVLLSSFFAHSMVFAHMPKAQLPFVLFSETFLTIRQNSLNVTVCMIACTFYQGYFIHSLSTLYYYSAPSLATRLTGPLNGAKLSVEWKTATEYTPDFVK